MRIFLFRYNITFLRRANTQYLKPKLNHEKYSDQVAAKYISGCLHKVINNLNIFLHNRSSS